MCHRREVDFSRCDRRGLPIRGPADPVSIDDVEPEVLAMDDGLRRGQEARHEGPEFPAHRGEPGDAVPDVGEETVGPAGPTEIVGSVIATKELHTSLSQAWLVRRMKSADPLRRADRRI